MALVLAGVICAIVIHGLIGQLLAFVLIAFGLGEAVLLVFLEVGLSEDRERAREDRARDAQQRAAEEERLRKQPRPADARLGERRRRRPQSPRWRRRPG
jgi:hypothetical protein